MDHQIKDNVTNQNKENKIPLTDYFLKIYIPGYRITAKKNHQYKLFNCLIIIYLHKFLIMFFWHI